MAAQNHNHIAYLRPSPSLIAKGLELVEGYLANHRFSLGSNIKVDDVINEVILIFLK